MKTIIAPSFLSADARCWADEIRLIDQEGIRCLHLDVMDGHFVPNITFGPGPIQNLRSVTTMEFDAHLMVTEPSGMIPAFAQAGVDAITVHAEACRHLHRTLQQIKDLGLKAGVSLNPATPVAFIEPILDMVDRVLVMSVNPGYGGQKAILSMTRKIEQLRQWRQLNQYHYEIQADGGINLTNVGDFLAAGTDNLVIGSALYQPGKTVENIRAFVKIIEEFEHKGESRQVVSP